MNRVMYGYKFQFDQRYLIFIYNSFNKNLLLFLYVHQIKNTKYIILQSLNVFNGNWFFK